MPQATVLELSLEKGEISPLCSCTFGVVCAYALKSTARYSIWSSWNELGK